MQANARVFKHYRSKVMKAISEAIKDKFEAAYLQEEKNPTAFFDNLGWLYQDLIVIERDVVACFPLKTGTYIRTSYANTTKRSTQPFRYSLHPSQMRMRS